MTDVAAWPDVLTSIDARLDAIQGALDAGRIPTVEPFVPPAVDGPLPSALADRARAAMERGNALDERLQAESERIRGELRRVPRMPPPPAAARFEVDA